MSFDGIKVNHGSLEQGATDVRNSARKIESRLDELESQLNPLRSDWNGNAKLAYDQAKAKWDQAMTEMIELLDRASMGVSQSNDEYRQADQRGAGRFS